MAKRGTRTMGRGQLTAAPVLSVPSQAAAPAPTPTPDAETVILTVDAVSVGGVKCPAGAIIAPGVEGWPAHRVHAYLRDGRAVVKG